jgi:UDP-N-acetylglucosamine--N-acetylmuramyl-(pentapeptide) pyrophosphoryl-undecaprenol N-acetylglucosamine transferase
MRNFLKRKETMKEKKYMSPQKHKRIIISGGGTGGHIFPALSVANALRRLDPGMEILFVGAEGRMEMEKVPAAGYDIVGLPVAGFNRKNLIKNIAVLFKLWRSLRLAGRIIKDFRPDIVLGVGGYASGPVLRKAASRNIPVVIQEQNSYAGITNRLMAGRASLIFVAYDGMEKYFPKEKIIKSGNPVRQSFENLDSLRKEALEYFGLLTGRPVVLVLGGSLGAGTINRSLADRIDEITASEVQWIWQTGSNYFEDVNGLVGVTTASNVKVHGFINRMELAFSAADVIVSRAGAGTISELCLAGKPVILVPSPNVAEDHQTSNAMALVNRNAAVIVPDRNVHEKLLSEVMILVGDKERRRTLSDNIRAMADRDADVRIATEIIKLIGND